MKEKNHFKVLFFTALVLLAFISNIKAQSFTIDWPGGGTIDFSSLRSSSSYSSSSSSDGYSTGETCEYGSEAITDEYAQKAISLYDEGQQYYKEKKWIQAAKCFKKGMAWVNNELAYAKIKSWYVHAKAFELSDKGDFEFSIAVRYGEKKDLTKALKYYNNALKYYPNDQYVTKEKALVSSDIQYIKIDHKIATINKKIAKTRNELANQTSQLLGFQAAVDEWLNLAYDARRKARQTAMATMADLLIDKLSIKNEVETELDKASLRRIKALRNKRVFLDDICAEVLTSENLASLKTDADVIKVLQKADKALTTGDMIKELQSDNREELLRGILELISIVSRKSAYGKLISGGEMSIDAAYGWVAHSEAKNRVNQLLSLSETQYKSIKKLTDLYKSEIDYRRTLLATIPK